MKFETFGEGQDLLFLMGWGNKLDGDNERWFVDRLVEAGYRVHAGQLPTNISDFEAQYLAPTREYRDEHALQLAPVLSHSTGGLVAASLRPKAAIYMSPWWGFYGGKLRKTQLRIVAALPTDRRLLPIDFGREELGSLVTEAQWQDLPSKVSPSFIREIRDAQASMPEISADARVFCSLADTVVGLQAIGSRVEPTQVTLYDGKHELFSSAGREDNTEAVVDALDEIA
ncbi:lysophospholipase [Halorientalis brevis]|uniref:Lysophospholipase n=1 Tax=Halorientalis brevis TaxID=1126241 RepID=A0ABD6CBG5_9EURY|nr:lysophospholipase [Halorientalis brevis]